MRRKNYKQKYITKFGKFFFLKGRRKLRIDLLNFVNYKTIKYLKRKNFFINFFFLKWFFFFLKKNMIFSYLNNFKFNDFIITNTNFKKNYFFYDINKNNSLDFEKTKFIFLKKNYNLNFFFNNSYYLNNLTNYSVQNSLENFFFIDLNFSKLNINLNYLYFLNYNLFIFKLLEIYKIHIYLFLHFFLVF